VNVTKEIEVLSKSKNNEYTSLGISKPNAKSMDVIDMETHPLCSQSYTEAKSLKKQEKRWIWWMFSRSSSFITILQSVATQ
jgi:ureidoglycolate hydrolase